MDAILDELAKAHEELRELARGLHPAAFDRGLDAAIGALATRSPVPVEYDVVEERFSDELEVAVYYVAGEALTNAAKHAEASVVRVSVAVDDGAGARGGRRRPRRRGPGEGSGLIGLNDRVEALRGRLTVSGRRGAGTTRARRVPVAAERVGLRAWRTSSRTSRAATPARSRPCWPRSCSRSPPTS